MWQQQKQKIGYKIIFILIFFEQNIASFLKKDFLKFRLKLPFDFASH